MAAVTICSDFGAQENKVCHCFHCFPIYLPWSDGTRCLGSRGSSASKEPACNAGDLGSIPGSGRSPGEENDNPLKYSFLENPMDRGAWQATVRVAKSQTWLCLTPSLTYIYIYIYILHFNSVSNNSVSNIIEVWFCINSISDSKFFHFFFSF